MLDHGDWQIPRILTAPHGCLERGTSMEPEVTEILIFEVAGQRHGLPVADVQELLPAMSIMPVPGASLGVEGVINLRGVIVPVLDLRHRFGIPAKAIAVTDHFIVVRRADRQLALHVDNAVELARLDASAWSEVEASSFSAGQSTRVAKVGDGMVVIHQVQDLLAAASVTPVQLAEAAP
jgi:chemotaxis signal transduction protein